ncbi:MAG: helix-turn-helix domain-containing protein [Nitrospiraceae bacterium]
MNNSLTSTPVFLPSQVGGESESAGTDVWLNFASMVTEPKNELLTVARKHAATPRLRLGPCRYIQDRRLPGFKLGKEWRFVRSDLERWLQERTSVQPRS